MSKYIDDECRQCQEWVRPYGCVNAGCPIRIDYEAGMEEMAADFDHDKRREDRPLEGE